MFIIYFLKSLTDPSQTYIGYTTDLEKRLKDHNSGHSPHTLKYLPWELITYIAFNTEAKARNFEKYVKVGSGSALAKKRFW